MKVEVVVPQIGEAVAALRLTAWLKAVGDPVKKGDALFEVDSDKAIVEIESFVDGTLAEILTPAQHDVMPQQVVARIETSDILPLGAPPDQRDTARRVSPVARRIAEDLGVNLANVPGSGPGGRIITGDVRQFAGQRVDTRPALNHSLRVNASPKAKILARQVGVDLRGLQGTGVDGMIRVHDVEMAARMALPAVPHVTDLPSPPQGIQPLSKVRQTVALRTQESKQTVPHFYLLADVNMTQANRLRDYCRSTPGWEKAPTYTDLLIRACALTLAEMPVVNQSYSNGALVARNGVNIGVAVDTDSGLVVVVIPGANTRSLREVSLALRAAAERARKGVLKPSDLGEKSMVISNLGMYSVDAFIAIIDQPDPMILAVGQVADRIVAVNGQPAVQAMCTLTLSVDHRALDGAQGARFLERLKNHLENPYQLMGQQS